MGQFFPRRGRRLLIDALIGVASVTAVLALVVAIDAGAGSQVARAISGGSPTTGRVAVQFHEDTTTLVRSAWETARTYAPLTTFAAVGAALVLIMLRTK